MPVFEYKALNGDGRKISGILDADSKATATRKLKAQSLYPFNLYKLEASKPREQSRIKGQRFFNLFSRIGFAEVAMITRLLSTLISAGFPLIDAVSAVAKQTDNRAFHRVLSQVKDKIEQGNSFSEALSVYPGVFSSVYINMVAAGESSGTLDIVLERLADFAENREKTQKKIGASLAYPIIMALIGALVLTILMIYIVPGIVSIFSDMNHDLPLPTIILISISDFFISFWWAVLASPLVMTLIIYGIRQTKKGLLITDRLVLRLPIAGPLMQKLVAARLSRTLGSLLENGVPMLTALKISKNVAGNKIISNLIETAADKVEKGGELGNALTTSPYFPGLAIQMIQVGEKSGKMEGMLKKTADLFDNQVESSITAATALIEPMIILFMGVVVGLIIMAICLPIVEINQIIV